MRGKRAKKRKAAVDPRYNDKLAARFINKIMQDGKKTVAEKMFYTSLEEGAKDVGVEPMVFLNQVIDNIRPALEIKARRVGGANYHVPMPVSPSRQETLAVRWLVDITRAKSGDAFSNILKIEMIQAFNGEGDAVKKKEDTERMAEANKAFAHFRW
jgi:small subunit ribosomal protein S7